MGCTIRAQLHLIHGAPLRLNLLRHLPQPKLDHGILQRPLRRVQRADNPCVVPAASLANKVQPTVRSRTREEGVQTLKLTGPEQRKGARGVRVMIPVKGVVCLVLLAEELIRDTAGGVEPGEIAEDQVDQRTLPGWGVLANETGNALCVLRPGIGCQQHGGC